MNDNSVTVELDGDQVEDLVRKALLSAYGTQQCFLDEPDGKKLSRSIRRVIKYYSTCEQWKQFERENPRD